MSKKPKPAVAKPCYFAEARSYAKVVEAEIAFFDGLIQAKNNIPNIPSLQKSLKDAANFLQDHRGRSLNILVEFTVTDPRSGETHTMMLGTLLKPPQTKSHAQVTHFLCLADADHLLTKVHADFDFHPEADEKKPSPHVQLGGRMFDSIVEKLKNKGLKICWNDTVDKPRMPSLPISTALLWHWAFLEYQDSEQISGFLKNWHWKQLVKKAEQAVFLPFFRDGVQLIEGDPDKGFLNALYVPVPK